MNTLRINVPFRKEIAKLMYYDYCNKKDPLILAIHGAPGSLEDFKEISQSISSLGYRLIAPEFPGYKNSEISSKAKYIDYTDYRAELINSFLECLNIAKVCCVMGHSYGSACALHLAAHNDKFSSAAFFNGMGLTHHRALRPYPFIYGVSVGLSIPLVRMPIRLLLRYAFNAKGFSLEKDEGLENAIKGFGKISFKQIKADGDALRGSGKPVLIATCENDRLIEPAIVRTFISHLNITQTSTYDQHLNLTSGPGICIGSQAHIFERGGHVVHRAHHQILAQRLAHMLQPIRDSHPLP